QPGRTDERTVLQVARLTEQPAEAQVGTQRAGAGAARLDPHRLAEQDGALDVQIGAAAGDGALQVAAAAEADGAVQRGQHAAALDVAGADVAVVVAQGDGHARSEEHTSELQSREKLVCRLLLEKKNSRVIARSSI